MRRTSAETQVEHLLGHQYARIAHDRAARRRGDRVTAREHRVRIQRLQPRAGGSQVAHAQLGLPRLGRLQPQRELTDALELPRGIGAGAAHAMRELG